MAKELDTIREIKELNSTKKKLDNARQAVKMRQEDFDLRLNNIEEKLGVSSDSLIALGRIAARYFGLTISAEKFEEELIFIFSDSDIYEYVESEKKELPYAEVLAELAKVLNDKPDELKKAVSVKAAETTINSDTTNKENVAEGKT